jgi:ABC-type molybdate transport system permease subunit
MNVGDYLIWETMNGLLLIPTVIGFVMLVRWFRRQPVFLALEWFAGAVLIAMTGILLIVARWLR